MDTPETAPDTERAGRRRRKISSDQLVFFNRQLASMVRMNFPLPLGLKSLAKEVQDDPAFYNLVADVQGDLDQGVPLQDALEKQAEFPPLYVEILRAGEATGNLASVLDDLARYSETMDNVRRRIKEAITYPLLVGALSLLMILVVLLFVVPQFEQVIRARMGSHATASLPLASRLVFGVSWFVRTWAISIPLGIVAGIGLFFLIRRFRRAGADFEQFMFKIPAFGPVFEKATLLKVCRSLGDLLRNGVSMVESLALTARVAGNNKVRETLNEMKRDVENGERISRRLDIVPVFPETMRWKLQMAEDRGILEEALDELSRQFQEELEMVSSRIIRIIGPIFIAIIAGIVGLIIIACYLPVFQLMAGPVK
ncbi:MAG: type II secretion system F family protein [Planctomycetota bacterium]|nr:MAG: type II secretion system F family protein [Planctomycetota bacterium]